MSNLTARVLSALVLLPIVVGATVLGGYPFAALLAVAAAVAWYEVLNMGRQSGMRPFSFSGGVLAVVITLAPLLGQLAWIAAVLLAVLSISTAAILRDDLVGVLPDVTYSLTAVFWIALPLSFALYLRQTTWGMGWVLSAMLITWACDTGAYFVGRAIGKHPMAKLISPKKTVEGLVGGLASAVAVGAVCAIWVLSEPLWLGLLVGLVGGLASVVGDLFESLIKRQLGVKDSGRTIPGHGGLLDRIDSLLFAIPVVTLCVILNQGA